MPPADSDPPRKHYQLKPSEFDRVNPPPGTPDAAGPIDVANLYRQANSPAAKPPPPQKPAKDANDVQAILRDNLARADAAGLNKIKPAPPRRSRRKRDYIVTLLAGNAGILGIGFMTGQAQITSPNAGAVTVAVSIFSGLILFNVGITWIMWFVMDDY